MREGAKLELQQYKDVIGKIPEEIRNALNTNMGKEHFLLDAD